MQKRINLQMFASLDEIIEANTQAFEGSNIKDQFTEITSKLGELGIDVLLNDRKKAEYVPASRLSEVVSQRDNFKTQLQKLNNELENLKKSAGDNSELKAKYDKLIGTNNDLLKELETTKINMEIMLAAKDAINPKDVLAFINFDNVKINSKGEVSGVDAEIARLKSEKPYLFTSEKKKAGVDESGKDDTITGGMNALLRRAAGRL